MNRRALSLLLILLFSFTLLLPGCGEKQPSISTDPPPLPELLTEEPPPWRDPVTGESSPSQGEESSSEPDTAPPESSRPRTDPDFVPVDISGETEDAPAATGSFREESPENLVHLPGDPSQNTEKPCELQDELERLLARQSGVWSLYLKNLDTLETVSIRDEAMVAASLVKLYVAGAYYAADPEGENQERCQLVRAMISNSSNEACNRLIDLLGKDNINDFAQAEGFPNTRLNRKMLEPVPVENYTSTRECGAVLESILEGSYVSPAASRDLLQELKDQERTGKLPAGVPHGVETANKTGELSNVENDVCIVWSEGGTYILCVMASDLPNTYEARQTIIEISRIVYQFFNEPQS